MIVNNIGGKGGGLVPLIVVTAPTGSTVTCDSVVGTEVQGVWTFPVAIGTHTIVATQGTQSKTETVNVDKVGLFPVTIKYSRLPEGYIETEYTRGNGNSYSDTGLKVADAYRFEITARFNSVYAYDTWFMGDWSSGRCYLCGYYQNLRIGVGNDDVSHRMDIPNDSNFHTYKATDNQFLIDGVVGQYSPNWSMMPTNGRNIPLFKSYHINASPVYRDIKEVIFTNASGVDVAHFVSCINPSNIAGHYDIIRDAFYGSVTSTPFIAGEPI